MDPFLRAIDQRSSSSELNIGGSNSVFENALAKHGAVRLDADLEGFNAARSVGESGPAYVAVVAHSYGTTTSAYALHDLSFPVDSATFVASAGIDSSVVPNAGALSVVSVNGHEQFYATQASGDVIATVGRTIDPAAMRVGAVGLSPGTPLGPENYRVNPDARFGATRFGADGGYDGTTYYEGTNGHDALGGSGLGSVTGATSGHGYFDLGTEGLHDVALASTGQGASIEALSTLPPDHPARPLVQ